MREQYRREANCQIVHDSILGRGLADPYLVLVDGRVAGYGGVWNKHHTGRVMEFHTLPEAREATHPMFRKLLDVSHAKPIEAQTNMPLMMAMLEAYAKNIVEEAIPFADAPSTDLVCPGAVFRRATPKDAETIFLHQREPVGEWVIEKCGKIVATGGFLTHYNPPYADIFMEVAEQARGHGIGSYLVQELKRVCREGGFKPAARCDPKNVASRRTLERAGMAVVGRLLVGKVLVPTRIYPI